MNYKAHLKEAMTQLGSDPKTIVVGYNTSSHGGNAAGSLSGFPQDRIEEMPLAENLMSSVAIGLSLEGWIPVVWIERMDFVLIALDSIVNHLDKIGELSEGLHKPACIIRVCVGNTQVPLFTGSTHTQCFTKAIRKMVKFPVVSLFKCADILPAYRNALAIAKEGHSTMIVERKDFYETV